MVSRRTILRAGGGLAAVSVAAAAAGPALASGSPNWDRLDRLLTGDLVRPPDPGYDQARQLFLAQYDTIRPRAVALCETVQDIQHCLRFAQHSGIKVALRSGGHSFAGWSTTTGLVVDVSRLNGVQVANSAVTFGPGIQGIDLMATLAPHGLSAVSGMCATIGMGGYLSGGGIGAQTRKYGIASDRLLAAEMVLADGRVVRCSPDEHPDLFWAIRGGGGGNFGVLTKLRVRPVPATGFANAVVVWPWDAAADVLNAYQRWHINAPDELNTLMSVVVEDAAPGVVPDVVLTASWHGDGAGAGLQRALDELIADAGQPVFSDVQQESFLRGMMTLYECGHLTVPECHRIGTNPVARLQRENYIAHRGRLLSRPIPAAGIEDLLEHLVSQLRSGHLRYLWFQGMGGRSNQVPADATAWVHRDTHFLISNVAIPHTPSPDPETLAAVHTWINDGLPLIQRYSNGENYVAFPDPEQSDWRRSYYGRNYDRLVAVKRRYDPHNFFRHPQSIGS